MAVALRIVTCLLVNRKKAQYFPCSCVVLNKRSINFLQFFTVYVSNNVQDDYNAKPCQRGRDGMYSLSLNRTCQGLSRYNICLVYTVYGYTTSIFLEIFRFIKVTMRHDKK